MKMKIKKQNFRIAWYTCLSIALLILSFCITVQYHTQKIADNTLENQDTDDLVAMVRSLNEKRDDLETELDNLNRTYQSLDYAEHIEKQLQQLSMVIGTTAVSGPGISITITADSPILNLDLVDIVNELKVSGAEAIAINNIRITTQSHIAQEQDAKGNNVITLDNQKLLTPIVITAIGNPDTLEKGLTLTGGIIDNLTTLYNIRPIIKQEEKIYIPKATINQTPTYKKTVSDTETQSNK